MEDIRKPSGRPCKAVHCGGDGIRTHIWLLAKQLLPCQATPPDDIHEPNYSDICWREQRMLAFSSDTPQHRSIAFDLLPNLIHLLAEQFRCTSFVHHCSCTSATVPGMNARDGASTHLYHALISECSKDVQSSLPRCTGRT